MSNLVGVFIVGGMYGMPPPPMNRYGLGIAMGPAAAAAMVFITV